MTNDLDMMIRDLHKEVYGFRPSSEWMQDWNNSSDSTKQKIWDEYIRVNDLNIDDAIAREDENLQELEDRMDAILSMNSSTMTDRDALRWLILSEVDHENDLTYGASYFNYTWNLNSKNPFTETIQSICDEILQKVRSGTMQRTWQTG